jgi:pimeloyl-ACP methyl ester carboxylesterase
MLSSPTTLPYPHPGPINHIPAPSAEEFDLEFGGLLPEGVTIPSSWGHTRYYLFHPQLTSTGRNVVILHGGGTPALGLAPLAHKLSASGNCVVVYDLWSHGLSSTPLVAHTPALFHTQLLEVLLYLKWTSAHLIGFSIGGSIATSFASLHPQAVDSITLVAPAGLLSKSSRSWLDSVYLDGGWGREWLSRNTIMAFVNGKNPQVDPNWKEMLRKGRVDSVAVEKWERETHKGHVAGIVSMFRFGGVYDEQNSYELLNRTGVAKFVILGSQDVVIEPKATEFKLREMGWQGVLHVIDGATHEIVRSHTARVAELTEQFWRSI